MRIRDEFVCACIWVGKDEDCESSNYKANEFIMAADCEKARARSESFLD